MLMAGSDAARDQRLIALEVDQTNGGTIADQNITVAALESGACDDGASARTTAVVDPGGDRGQPGPTILVGKRNAVVHLVDVGSRVKPVGIFELPSQPRGEKCANGRLAASRNPHDDHHRGAWRRSVFRRRGLQGHQAAPADAAARSMNQWRRPTGRTTRCGKCPVSGLGAGDNLPLFLSRNQECDIAAAVERRISQRDARLGFRANDSDRPSSRFPQRRLTGEQ